MKYRPHEIVDYHYDARTGGIRAACWCYPGVAFVTAPNGKPGCITVHNDGLWVEHAIELDGCAPV